jgi:peptidoglycan/LPS O-acetylase OafA/YrhL
MFRSKVKSKPNSFDLLRLVAATVVLITHQFQVLGQPQPKILGLAEPSFFAVLVFFALSGRLITQSWERDPQTRNFLLKRCLRIFPALVAVVTLTVFVVGPVFTTLGVREYFLNAMTWKYFRCIILWPGHSWLPGVFWTNPYPHAVNAPLWTLPVEFALYLSVLAAGVLGFLRRPHMISIGVLCLTLFAAIAPFSGNVNLKNVAMLAAMFWWGAWLPIDVQSGRPFNKIDLSLGLVALMILATIGPDSMARTGQILFAGGLVWLASQIQFGDRITRQFGDLSYGVYIIAYPVQQSLVAAFGKEAFSYLVYLTMTCAITFPLALLSWHLVEKRFIRMKATLLSTAASSNS